jgi:hypothetical protein
MLLSILQRSSKHSSVSFLYFKKEHSYTVDNLEDAPKKEVKPPIKLTSERFIYKYGISKWSTVPRKSYVNNKQCRQFILVILMPHFKFHCNKNGDFHPRTQRRMGERSGVYY